jgi:hypothetical protein
MNEAWAACGGAVVSFLIGWGMMRARLTELERRTTYNELQSNKQLELIHGLREVYVSYQHFNEIMTSIRETQREMNHKMERILELLTERA